MKLATGRYIVSPSNTVS